MTYNVKYEDVQSRILELIEAASRGEDVFILRNNRPVVRIIATGFPKRPARFGSAQGSVHIAQDFDAPLSDFGDYMP